MEPSFEICKECSRKRSLDFLYCLENWLSLKDEPTIENWSTFFTLYYMLS